MSSFDSLKQLVADYLEPNAVQAIEQAYLFSDKAHRGQLRKTGEPYIIHPVAAATILAEVKMDSQTIIATLLHDVLEDTHINKDILVEKFGEEIANLVDGVSKLKQVKFSSQAEAQAENFRKMVVAMAKDIRVILVKLADRLHNLRTIASLSRSKQVRIARETIEIYAPIANRLGIYRLYTELEDLCLQCLYPNRFATLSKATSAVYVGHKELLSSFKQNISLSLAQAGITDFEITTRKKHLYSIYRKMKIKHMSFNDIMDMYGVRIIVNSIDACYRALGIVHGLYKPVSSRFKDYIAIPKSNNYQSLHTVLLGPFSLRLEVQIRTVNMHRIAQFGIAAHWAYKTSSSSKVGHKFVQELEHIQHTISDSLDFIESIKIDLSPDEVYVFTPAGDIVKLTHNATPVDFAYHVHSEIGNSCVGAKVNRKFAPLNTKLANGQTVEIITNDTARPHEAWLTFVSTSKARNGIKNYLRHQQIDEAKDLGMRMLANELVKLNSSITNISAESLSEIIQELELESTDELYSQIGMGNQYPIMIARKALGLDTNKKVTNDGYLYIRGTEGMVVHFAECCRPIPGDLIVGHLRSGHGLDVHLDNCRQVTSFCNKPEHYLRLRWSDDITGDFKVDLKVEVVNKKRVLAFLASTISDANANIDNITVDPRGRGFMKVYFTLSLKNRDHLAAVMRKIRALKFVISQHRRKQADDY